MGHKGEHKLVTVNGICFCFTCVSGTSLHVAPKKIRVSLDYKFCENCGIALPIVPEQYCHFCEIKL